MLQFSGILSILTNKMTYNNEDLTVGQIADEKNVHKWGTLVVINTGWLEICSK